MKRLLVSVVLLVLVGVPLLVVTAAFLCFEDQPALRRVAEFTPQHIERARRILELHDPRKSRDGVRNTVKISGEDLDLAVSYLANRYGGSARITLQPGRLGIAASFEVPRSPFGRFINVHASLRGTAGLPVLDSLRVGRLPVPGWLGERVQAAALWALQRNEEMRSAASAIRSVDLTAAGVRIVYEWHEDLADRLRSAALTPAERERLRIYHERLAQFTRDEASPRRLSLARLLAPLMRLAGERSAGGDPRAENRALIAVVAFYVNGRGLAVLLPEAKTWSQPVRHVVTLANRHDFAQHFIVSAALAAFAGSPLSDAIGVYKELDDSRGGSGFSFNDIAADRAGTVFGDVATRSSHSARALQQRFVTGVTEGDIMPNVADLPEFMPEREFKRRFGGVGEPAYAAMMQEIERRVAALALYR